MPTRSRHPLRRPTPAMPSSDLATLIRAPVTVVRPATRLSPARRHRQQLTTRRLPSMPRVRTWRLSRAHPRTLTRVVITRARKPAAAATPLPPITPRAPRRRPKAHTCRQVSKARVCLAHRRRVRAEAPATLARIPWPWATLWSVSSMRRLIATCSDVWIAAVSSHSSIVLDLIRRACTEPATLHCQRLISGPPCGPVGLGAGGGIILTGSISISSSWSFQFHDFERISPLCQLEMLVHVHNPGGNRLVRVCPPVCTGFGIHGVKRSRKERLTARWDGVSAFTCTYCLKAWRGWSWRSRSLFARVAAAVLSPWRQRLACCWHAHEQPGCR